MDILNRKFVTPVYTVFLFILLLASGTMISHANYQASQKQKVIAGAIYKFIKFVEWETEASKSQASFNVCLLQHDAAFEPFKQRKIQGKAINIVLVDGHENADACHVLYLNLAETDSKKILQSLTNKSVLTISEQAGFAAQGGIVELGNTNNRLTFSINLLAAKAQSLNIGFQLLSLAKKVIES
ncbi:MAG: DUF4154 domain-containing protein [Methylococcaceae bacterium]|nr:DUF4154 domain-containing protein [Methylococcaceae bacterium]